MKDDEKSTTDEKIAALQEKCVDDPVGLAEELNKLWFTTMGEEKIEKVVNAQSKVIPEAIKRLKKDYADDLTELVKKLRGFWFTALGNTNADKINAAVFAVDSKKKNTKESIGKPPNI